MTLPANFRGARGRRKLENHCPGLQGVLLLVLLTTSTGRLVCRLAVPCFREETWPASGNCMSIAFRLSLARGINQPGPFTLDERGRLVPYSIHETGRSYAFLASAERGRASSSCHLIGSAVPRQRRQLRKGKCEPDFRLGPYGA